MSDIVIESLNAVIVGLTLLALMRGRRSLQIREVRGWSLLLTGFTLLFFGTLIDITDNFESLNWLVVVGDTPVQAILEKVVGGLLGFMLLAVGIWQWLPRLIEHQKLVAEKFEKAKDEVNVLQGLLPICSCCKKVRDDKGYWNQIESYVTERSDASFSHGICPSCLEKRYPKQYGSMMAKKAEQGV